MRPAVVEQPGEPGDPGLATPAWRPRPGDPGLATPARRTAGRPGDGGGPGTWGFVFPRPRPGLPGEAQVLHEGVGDAAHQRVPVQPGPGPAFEVAEPQLALQLLVGLLAYPARLDGGRQRPHRGARWQVGQAVFALARRTPLADQPGFLARQEPIVGPGCAIGNPDADGREPGLELALGALPPGHAPPGQCGQRVLGGPRLLVRHGLARTSCQRGALHVRAIDLLVAGDADRPQQPPLVEGVPERGTGAVARIGQHAAEPRAGRSHAVQPRQRDLALGAGHRLRLGHACPGAAIEISDPLVGQEQAQGHRNRHLALRQGERRQ